MKWRRKREDGFSLLELIVVVAVVLVVTAMALPNILQMIYNVRLRSSAYGLSGLMQAARTQAVRDNTYYYVCYKAIGNSTFSWIASDNTCTAPPPGAQQVQMGSNVSIVTSGAPSGLTTTALGFGEPSGALATAKPAFNSRGIPCYVSGSRCSSMYNLGPIALTVSYVTYLTDTRPFQNNGWAAVAISPAGRLQVWTYNGTAWQR